MSLSYKPLNVYKVIDPIIHIDSSRSYNVLSGPRELQWKPNISTNYASSQVSFSVPPPSEQTVVDRSIKQKWSVLFVLQGVGLNGGNLVNFDSGTIALRKSPIASCISTQSVTLNNTAVSNNVQDLVDPMFKYSISKDEQNGSLSESPDMDDQFQNYNDGLGWSRNPLSLYGGNVDQQTRGAFNFTGGSSPSLVVNYNNNTGASFVYTVTENIFLDPFTFGDYDASGFVGLRNMDFTFTIGNLSRMLSINSSAGSITNLTAQFNSAPVLLFKYATLNELVQPFESNKPYVYPYNNVTRYATPSGSSLSSNAQLTLTSNNLQINSIPQRLYIFVRDQNQSLTYNSSDVYCVLENLNITWQNRNGLLASATKQDLYNICARNGCKQSWAQWSQYQGSIMAVDMGRDIGMDPLEAPGLLGNFQLTVTATVTNCNQSNSLVNPTLYIISVEAGTFTIVNGTSVPMIGVLSRQDILSSQASQMLDFNTHKNIYGGSIFSTLRNFGENVYNGVKNNLPFIRKVSAAVKPFLPAGAESALSAIGLGRRRRSRKGKGVEAEDSDTEVEQSEVDEGEQSEKEESPVKYKKKERKSRNEKLTAKIDRYSR